MKVKLNGNDFFNVSCPFGSTDPLHPTGHKGLDLVMNTGTPLNSPVDGIISKIVDYGDKNVGKGILIETDDHKTVILGHLSEFKAKVGDKVSEGDLVALSGNTGRSTGSHLHLGLKDQSGNFVDPEPLLSNDKSFYDTVFQKEGIITKLSNADNNDVSFMDGAKSFGDFLSKWHETGSFWEAMYGKPFSQVMGDFFSQLGYDISVFILDNGDLFFLAPAIIFMFATFFIGRNKYTKWIIPLWFTYFVSSVFGQLIK